MCHYLVTWQTMKIGFRAEAAANAQTYRQHDSPLWDETQQALQAIASGASRAREVELRMPGGVAWSISVQVHGRDDTYQIVWAEIGSTGIANVVHLGPALS